MEESNTSFKYKALLIPLIIMVIMGAAIFIPAGSLGYWQGRLFWTINLVSILFITVYFLKRNPELLSRRMTTKEKKTTKKAPAILNLYLLGYLIPGLDYRFHWSDVPAALVLAASVIYLFGFILISRVFLENTYASTVIQVEEEQKVITSGPYKIVRHPMYTGILLMLLFSPLALGSYWAIIPFLLSIPIQVIRIKSEEEVLLQDLRGYREYCVKTPYRLIPLIW